MLGHSWERSPAAALINDGFPLGMAIPNEGLLRVSSTVQPHQQRYIYYIQRPNADNALYLPRRDPRLARGRCGDDQRRRASISTYKDRTSILTDLERKSTSFPEEQLANLQFFRAEAKQKMKYGLGRSGRVGSHQRPPDRRSRPVPPPIDARGGAPPKTDLKAECMT